ncbi:hypothetical protein [Enterococcus sp. DIV0179]|uniref:hypothetical protein n=1 Tax=Enterococcus sp. DIV0179 TaxID=2774767 RepID=UPI003D2FEA75
MNLIISEILNETNVAVAALVISLVFSTISLIIETYRYNKSNRINTELDFFKSIFHEHLVENIPKARSKVQRTQSGKIEGIDELTDILNIVRQDALFFRFRDKSFYDNLRKKLQSLEDKLTKLGKMDEEQYDDFRIEMNQEIENIYKLILNKEAGIEEKKKGITNFLKANFMYVVLVGVILFLLIFVTVLFFR